MLLGFHKAQGYKVVKSDFIAESVIESKTMKEKLALSNKVQYHACWEQLKLCQQWKLGLTNLL